MITSREIAVAVLAEMRRTMGRDEVRAVTVEGLESSGLVADALANCEGEGVVVPTDTGCEVVREGVRMAVEMARVSG